MSRGGGKEPEYHRKTVQPFLPCKLFFIFQYTDMTKVNENHAGGVNLCCDLPMISSLTDSAAFKRPS